MDEGMITTNKHNYANLLQKMACLSPQSDVCLTISL